MFWKLLSALTLVNFGGPEIDRAALSRYLSEAVFFPTALLPSRNLSWEAISEDSAKAKLTHKGQQVSAVFHFNRAGQVTHLESSDRPRQTNPLLLVLLCLLKYGIHSLNKSTLLIGEAYGIQGQSHG